MNPVSWFDMPYEDMTRLIGFYSEVFGWEMKKMGEEMGNYVIAQTAETGEDGMVKMPGVINGGFFPREKDSNQYPSVVVSVDDLRGSMKKVGEAGGEVLGEIVEIPGVGEYVSFKDTEGNVVGMLEPKGMDDKKSMKGGMK